MTFELIQDIVKVNACTKFWVPTSNGSAMRELTDTHTQTDGTDFIPSTADAGGKNTSCDLLYVTVLGTVIDCSLILLLH